MRPEGNPLDLNNLPEDYSSNNGKQVILEDTSFCASGAAGGGYSMRKKKSSGKEECGKVYECRFCSLKFCKSQALGGHMNRHRQERETETLNRARQLVFSSDTLLAQGTHHLGCQGGGIPPHHHGGYHHQANNMGDPTLQYRSIYPTTATTTTTRLFSGQAPPPPPAYMYGAASSTPARQQLVSFSPSSHHQYPVNDYFLGHHVLPTSSQSSPSYTAAALPESSSSSYTCIGAPVMGPQGIPPRDVSLYPNASPITRFQDGF